MSISIERHLELNIILSSRNLRSSIRRADRLGKALEAGLAPTVTPSPEPLPDLPETAPAGRGKAKAAEVAARARQAQLAALAHQAGPGWGLVAFNVGLVRESVEIAVLWRDSKTRETAAAGVIAKKGGGEKVVVEPPPLLSPEEHDRRLCEVLHVPYPPKHLAWGPVPDDDHQPEPSPLENVVHDAGDPAIEDDPPPEPQDHTGSPLSPAEAERLQRELRKALEMEKQEKEAPPPRPSSPQVFRAEDRDQPDPGAWRREYGVFRLGR